MTLMVTTIAHTLPNDSAPFMSTSTSTFSSPPRSCNRILESLSTTSTSRKLAKHRDRDAAEKNSDLISSNQMRARLGPMRGIMEHTLRIFREAETPDEWQQVKQTCVTLLDLSRACYSSSLKLAATNLIQDIIQSIGPRSNPDAFPMHTYLAALLSNFHISEEHENAIRTSALPAPCLLKIENPGTSYDNLTGGREVDVLILGATGSGKSIVVKRIHSTLRQKGVTEFEYYRERLIRDMIESMKTIIKKNAGEEATAPLDLSCSIALADAELSILTLPTNLLHFLIQPSPPLPFKLEDVSQALCMLWNAPTVRLIVRRLEAQGCIVPNANYLFDSANRIFAPDYKPSREDILRYQQGQMIQGSVLKHGSSTFNMIEVPWKESRHGRMDHLERYGHPEVVLFVVALSDYNQAVSDSDTTRTILDESLASFDLIVNSRWLTGAIIVLVLTKHDKFEKELAYLPLKYWMPGYQGETYEQARIYIEKRYTDLVKDKERLILTHHIGPSMSGLLSVIQSKLVGSRENAADSLGRY